MDEKKQRIALDTMKDLIITLKTAAENKQTLNFTKSEDDLHQGFQKDVCEFDMCDGGGYNRVISNGQTVSVRCKCYLETVLKRKLTNSHIQPNFWGVEMEDMKSIEDKIFISHLKPKLIQEERVVPKTKKAIAPETPKEYVARTYDTKDIKKGLFYFTDNYTKKVIGMLEEYPRNKTLNLMLMGDPGKGKTQMACAIAKEFMRKGKTVYFTRMRTLLDESFDNKAYIREIVRTKDLLIIDELGQEYHTDTKWALKQIQDIFKERQETGLPTICTTNAYPNELEEYYEGSLMSTFHGRFLMMMLYGDYDLRTIDARKTYEELDFLND